MGDSLCCKVLSMLLLGLKGDVVFGEDFLIVSTDLLTVIAFEVVMCRFLPLLTLIESLFESQYPPLLEQSRIYTIKRFLLQ